MMKTIARFPVGLSIALACNSIDGPAPPSAPINACPEHPCEAYVAQPTPDTPACTTTPCCVAGQCLVQGLTSGLVMLVALPEDLYFAPGRTFAIPFEQLFAPGAEVHFTSGRTCGPPDCFALPDWGTVQNQYLVSAALAKSPPPAGVGWDLGNAGYTALPVQTTFRLMWPATAGSLSDAESIGLPVSPIAASLSIDSFGIPGPFGGPSLTYETYLQPGTYERIVQPSAPYDRAFAPEVKIVTVTAGTSGEALDRVDSFDLTQETGEVQTPTLPTFTISSAVPLDGWTAYLRDSAKQTISNIFPLHGTSTPNVVLATNHVPAGVDALTNATLVVAPPAGTPFPTGLFAPVANILPAEEHYPLLPPPVTVSGTVQGTDGSGVAADIIFEAISITDANGIAYTTNFEFVASASTVVSTTDGPSVLDASGMTSFASYTVVLPPGQYRATVRPLLGTAEVTTFSSFVVDSASAGMPQDLVVSPPLFIEGDAVVTDARPLSQATVEALPAGCADGTSPWCLPRPAQTTTRPDGTFGVALDPGQYILRVRPADGSGLPWVVQPLSVLAQIPANYIVKPHVKIPAPSSAGLTLLDPSANPIVNAVVRAFWVPAQGSAVEIGQSITDANGRYEMYLTPPSQ